jgi:phenylalanyl-tRNA synthetase beta chain
VLRSGERHHTRTESQTRWEKGVDPELAGAAAAYASQLLVELSGARWTGEGEARSDWPPPATIAYRPAQAAAVLGLEIGEAEQRDRLERLGFGVDQDWTVHTPSWRARDVRRDIDLVEEVARFRLRDVPATLPLRQAMFGRLTHAQRLRRQVEDVLVGAGMYEAYTYSLQAEDPDPNAIVLPVPLSSQHRVLRTTLRLGLLDAARHNVAMGNGNAKLFEVAHVYLPAPGVPEERWRLGGVLQGDFVVAKGIVELVFAALKAEPRFEALQLFPEASVGASVQAGWVAQYAPPGLDLDGEWSAFELDLAELFAMVPERIIYRDVITYPPLLFDLAFVVDEGVPVGDLLDAAFAAAGDELREARFLSDYRGDQIAAGKKSVALGFAFQSAQRTLADEDGARLRAAIVRALAERFGAELRAA